MIPVENALPAVRWQFRAVAGVDHVWRLGDHVANGSEIARVPAGEIETAVVAQIRLLVRQPEVIVGTWQAARATGPDLTEHVVKEARDQLAPLWEDLFPVEQARIIHLLVDRVEIGASGATVRLRLEGLTGLVRDLGARDRQEAA
jgi:site-specific DNA recombinase